jgi:hypothetical protein
VTPTKPRLLMVAPYCYPPMGAEAIVTTKLAVAFLEAGWDLVIVTDSQIEGFYPLGTGGRFKALETHIHDLHVWKPRAITAGSGSSPRARRASPLRGVAWSLRAAAHAGRLLRRERFDLLLSRSMPQYGHLAGLLLSSRRHVPWIASWSDPLPLRKAPPPYGGGAEAKSNGASMRYCRAVAASADWHVFPSERMRRYVASYLPACGSKSSGIPHVALEETVTTQVPPNHSFVVCHAGGGLALRAPDVLLEGFARFARTVGPQGTVGLHFIGARREHILSARWDGVLGHLLSFEEAKPYEETLRACARASVLLVVEADCADGIFLPSKFVDYVQIGRPILVVSPVAGTLADLLRAHGGGVAADCSSVDAVKSALLELYAHWQGGTLETAFEPSALRAQFSGATVVGAYNAILTRLSRAAPGGAGS